MRTLPTRRFGCSALGYAVAFAVLLPSAIASPVSTRSSAAAHPVPTRWYRARAIRRDLEALPERSRSAALYSRAIEAFRAVYYDDPANLHAPASIFAVADLLAMEGRGLHLPSASEAAVTQYRFLRTLYPDSSLIPPALLAEGRIEQDDLKDAPAARATYALLLKTHPGSPQAQTARLAFRSTSSTVPRHPGTVPTEPSSVPVSRSTEAPPSLAATSSAKPSIAASSPPIATPPPQQTAPAASARHPGLPPMPTTSDSANAQRLIHVPAREAVTTPASSGATQPVARSQSSPGVVASSPKRSTAVPATPSNHAAAVVTGIRHWSTPTYTRVAIDLGDDVTYEAARVPDPDRLLFDLHGTRLSSALVNKTFNVTDDGFLRKIRAAQSDTETTRVVLDVSSVSDYSAFLLPNPYRLIIDIHGRGQEGAPGDGTINDVRSLGERVSTLPPPGLQMTSTGTAPTKAVPDTIAVATPGGGAGLAAVGRQPGRVDATVEPTSKPVVAVVPRASLPDVPAVAVPAGKHAKGRAPVVAAPVSIAGAPARAASPTAAGETSLVRALGLKVDRIVIDAGHGGHDSGTLGSGGIQEKDVVLDVALRLGHLLHERLGAEIIYTRSDDTFVPLETRTAIANQAQADLFLSIHANSSPDATARGVETYYLNFTSQADALEVAARENAVSGQSIHQLSDLVKKIALKDKIEESREFAGDVERSLYGGLVPGSGGLKDRGVKKAPFVVLIGANMPSVLAEISFVTNERDAEQLRRPEYRQRVAESLYKGVAKYQSGLGETRASVERVGGN